MRNDVSVIMPVFNAQEYVGRAVRATLDQLYADFELIICDDGSTDATLDEVYRAAAHDARVRVISHEHSGVCFSRNAGLSAARGAYIVFADCDDIPSPTWLAALMHGIEDADISICGYEVCSEEGTLRYDTSWARTRPADIDTWTAMTARQLIVDLFSNDLMYQGYVWNKLFRRSLIEKDRPLRFQRGITCNEDRLFVFEYLLRCNHAHVNMRPFYTYHSHEEPSCYNASQATELIAFDRMRECLGDRVKEEPCNHSWSQALFYLEKDYFRALVDLYSRARKSMDPDVLWLGEALLERRGYADEFDEYSDEYQAKIARALSDAGTARS